MNIRVIREPSIGVATGGVVFIDGFYECFSIEDVIREQPGQPVETWKVRGETAIPQGRYRVVLTHSQRFGRVLPLLVDVPGFRGIRIHPGNTAADTEGCLLFGTGRQPGRVTGSQVACERVMQRFMAESEGNHWIRIENPEA